MTDNTILDLALKPVELKADDYEQDGLVYCGVCHAKKQCRVELFGAVRTVVCMCKCETERFEKAEAQAKKNAEVARISALRTSGLQDKSYQSWTFAADDGKTSQNMEKAKNYCAKWGEVYAQNIGLRLYGGVGTGKTFMAACIANELISRGVPVLMTNFIKLANAISQGYGDDKNTYIRALDSYDLLIIDDLGAERSSDFMMEHIFNIVDSRYRAGKPLIVTTNLQQQEFDNPPDVKTARIYDRVREMTVPIAFKGDNRRTQVADRKFKAAAQLLGGKIE